MMTYESVGRWVLPKRQKAEKLAKYEIGPTIAALLSSRGIEPEEERSFLYPTISQIPDFTQLYGAKDAAKLIKKHIVKGNKIIIHGDFDADGICATTLLWEFLYRELAEYIDKKIDVLPYIPDRVEEGYGLSESSINSIQKLGADLVITVDCGIRDEVLVGRVVSEGDMEMIITDHHLPPDDLFRKDQDLNIVHPIHPDHPYPHQQISGSMVALLLVQAIRHEFDLDYEFTEKTPGLDLAAFSSVTDMMPLTGSNRALLTFGLNQMRKGERMGLSALAVQAGIDLKDVDSYHLGFVLGPRINATGRIGDPMDGVRLLSTNSSTQATQIAARIEELNKERQRLTEEVMQQIEAQIEDDRAVIVAVGEGWPEGIIGLAAAKIMERYNKPTLVISKGKVDARGSARSLGGFHITNVLDELAPLLKKYGGHSEAAGFSIDENKIPEFKDSIQDIADERIEPGSLTRDLKIDLILTGNELDMRFIEQLQLTSPWGMGNPRPLQALLRCTILDKNPMGKEQDHLKLKLKPDYPDSIDAVMFNCLEDIEKLEVDDVIDLVGHLTLNRWNGNVSVQFSIKEWRYSE